MPGTNGTSVEVTTATANGFKLGDLINFSGMEPVDYLGNFRVTSVIDATHFTVSLYEYPGTPALTLGTVGEAYTDNRVGIHLHGGVTPWISDGTANQWITPAGENATYPTGVSTVNVPDMVTPPPGSTTFYYTNQQTARLMFYHDHTLGITRLNVYAGLQSGYLLTDAVEQNLINTGILPDNGTVLVLQDKTFIDPKTVLQTDPTWPIALKIGNSDLWTPHVWMPNQNPNDISGANGIGRWDYGAWFWPPWVTSFSEIQGAGGITVTNGGTGYSQPPLVSISAAPGDAGVGARAHAIIDSQGQVTGIQLDYPGTGYALPPTVILTPTVGDTTGSGATAIANSWVYPNVPNISQTMEAYQDTAMVNGTVYPYLNVDPKAYRYQLLNGSDDRMLNLQMYTSSSILSTITITNGGSGYDPVSPPLVTITPAPGDTTGYGGQALATVDPTTGALTSIAISVVGSGWTSPPLVTISAPTTVGGVTATATSTIYQGTSEVGMVPAQPGFTNFPAGWTVQTMGQVGNVLDGRYGGVPDPRNIGPSFIQIGNEGGFLPTPVVIPNQPIGFERNPKNIVIGNVAEHGLLMAPAERADVLIDFSKYAGMTVILYNDAPAGFPAADSRVDYFTNNANQIDGGGTASTLAGYGPNTRTFMVFHVSNVTPVPYNMPALMNAFTSTATQTGVFKADQQPPIIPNANYNSAYNAKFPAGPANTYANIAAQSLTFYPVDLTKATSLSTSPVTLNALPKAIQETFEASYGRMMANLGVEVPNTNGTNQTTISYVLQDPATEIMNGISISPVTANDGTQLWKITHNGVDTHVVHFHLFNVQVIDRVGWDGAIRLPDANELGWKDSVRMNPLEIIYVAMRAIAPQLPFGVPDSIHALDPTQPLGATMGFTNIAPNGTRVTVTNVVTNFGWEYMWHCHVLSHEEMMMMRPIDVIVPSILPVAPTLISPILPSPTTGLAVLSWQDGIPVTAASTMGNLANEIGFSIMRASYDPIAKTIGTYTQVGTSPANSTTFTDTTIASGAAYSYQVVAYNQAGKTASNDVLFTPPTSSVTQVTTSNTSGWYNAGKTISIGVAFNDIEVVTGIPTLTLNNGAVATYLSGSSTSVLTFTYNVVAGAAFDIAQLDYASMTALTLAGGSTIIGQTNHVQAALALPAIAGAADLLFSTKLGIDTTAPVLTPPSSTASPLTNVTGAVVKYTGAAIDAMSGVATSSFNPSSGSQFAAGTTTTVTYTATDVAGNTATSTFTVTVGNAGIVGTELVVYGTTGNDVISINTTNPAAVAVTLNGAAVYGSPFNLPAGDTIHVYGVAGNDIMSVTGAVGGILDGGTASSTFNITGWTPATGTLTGTGPNIVNETSNSNFTLTSSVLSVGNSAFTMSGVGTANLTGGAGNNTFTLTGWTGATTLTGGGGTDTVVDSADTNFTLSNAALTAGTQVIKLSGIGVANLTGGSSNNSFDVSGWTGSGSLTGGGGTDTVISSKTANMTITNTALTAVDGMSLVLSGITADTLTLANTPAVVSVSTPATVITATAFTGKSALAATGVGAVTLLGGTGNDTFTLTGETGRVTITGGGGADTVIDTSNSNFTLTNTSLTVGTQVITLTGISAATLTGGVGNNTFTITGWTGTSTTLTGGGGVDSVTDSINANFVLTNTNLTVGSQVISLAGITVANLSGRNSNSTFNVSGWTGTGTLTGRGRIDTVLATKDADMTLTNSRITASDGLNMTLSAITADSLILNNAVISRTINASAYSGSSTLGATGAGQAKLIGGSGNDNLIVSGTGTAVLVGNGGNDALTASGDGNVIMIGSTSGDTLTHSGSGQALEVSGRTAYDNNMAALDAVLAYWTSAATFAAKVTALSSAAGITGGYKFTGGNGGTVTQDPTTSNNTLSNTGGQTWFVVKAADAVTTKTADTRTNLI